MNIDFKRTKFILSAPKYSHLPTDKVLEVAIAGRSNAGKSTLINHLCNQNRLAKTSGVPGKTREMNLFSLNENHEMQARLVDLPGYGYAKANFSMQKQWQEELSHYLLYRDNLKVLMVIMDSRHPLTDLDQLTINLAARRNLRQILVFNKIDKLNQSEKHRLKAVMQLASEDWPNVVVVGHSSTKNLGTIELENILNTEIERNLNLLEKNQENTELD